MLTKRTTDIVPVEDFQERLRSVCGLFRPMPSKGQAEVRGAITVEQLAGIEVAHVAKDLRSISRSERDCRLDDNEFFFLIIQEEGSALMTQNDEARLMQPGDMMLIDSARPSEFNFFGKFGRQMSIHLPRSEMRARFGSNIRNGVFVPREDNTALALAAVLGKSFSPDCSIEQTSYLKDTVYSLLGVVLHEREDRCGFRAFEANLGEAQILKDAMAILDSRFGDCDLTIQGLSDDMRVSIRQLQRAFRAIGTTPTEYLMRKRMEKACQLLLARREGKLDMLVSSIAYSSGFSDISYFNRLFRRSFDISPGEYTGAMGQNVT